MDKDVRFPDIPEKDVLSHKTLNLQSMELDDSDLLSRKKEAIKEKKPQEEEEEDDQDLGDEEDEESFSEDVRQDTENGGGKNFEELKAYMLEAEKSDFKAQNKKILGELNGYLKNLTKKAKADQTSDCRSVNYYFGSWNFKGEKYLRKCIDGGRNATSE